jgi:hypothetical protein
VKYLSDVRTIILALLVSVAGASAATPAPIAPGGKPGKIEKQQTESLRGRQIRDLQWQNKVLWTHIQAIEMNLDCYGEAVEVDGGQIDACPIQIVVEP